MDAVNFLNLEYIVLNLSAVVQGWLVHLYAGATGTSEQVVATQGVNSPVATSHLFETLSFTGTQLALLGMALAIIFLAAAVWVRIKLEVTEHEGFHAREAKYHHAGHGAHGEAHAEHHEEPATNGRWDEVVQLANTTNESDWRRAIMEADIMLGEALATQGYRGTTVGDRLKDANPLQMTTLDIAWQAHKVRNEIAHAGSTFHLSEWDTKATIDFYRRVLEELKFI